MENKKQSFINIIDKNKGIIFKVCNSYCNNKEDRKDLAQDIIIELWKSFDKYNPQFKFTTWMYRIALNVAISTYRKSVTRKKYFSTLNFDFINVTDEEIESNNKDEVSILMRFINELDEMNKALMILYLDGNSHQEIAEILNITTSNVGTKIGRIKQRLKAKFEKISN